MTTSTGGSLTFCAISVSLYACILVCIPVYLSRVSLRLYIFVLVACISTLVRTGRYRNFAVHGQQGAVKCFSNVGGCPKEEWVLATVGNMHMHNGVLRR